MDVIPISSGTNLTALHWKTLYQESERRLGLHYNQQSPFFWLDPRLLGRRRYFVFGTTTVKDIASGSLNNMAEYVLAWNNAGAYLPTSEPNDFFRNYDMTQFDAAEAACSLLVIPSGSLDIRAITSSIGPTALIDRDSAFSDALTGSMFPLRVGTPSGWALDEYIKSWYYSPKVHRKNFTFGPEYSSSVYNCYLCANGSVNTFDVPPADRQAGPEYVDGYSPAEWLIFEVGGSWTFPQGYEHKTRFHRIHNFDSQVLSVDVGGTIWTICPGGCLAIRLNKLESGVYEIVKNTWAGNDGKTSGYFWPFQIGDVRILHPTQVAPGAPLVEGSSLDQNGNNLTDPLLLNWVMAYLSNGAIDAGAIIPAIQDLSRAQDIGPIYNNPSYTSRGKAFEAPIPKGGWYGPISDESTPLGDYLIHKGKLMFVSLNEQFSHHTQSFTATPDTFVLYRSEDGRQALQVSDVHMYSGSTSIPAFGPSYNWTSSVNITGTGSIFFTGSVFTDGQQVTATFVSKDPDNWHTDNFEGMAKLPALLARNSMSLVDASSTTLVDGTYFITSPDRDVQIVQLSTNFCTFIHGGTLGMDPHGDPTGSLINSVYCFETPVMQYVSDIFTTTDQVDWVVSDDGIGGGYANPVSSSLNVTNEYRTYYTGSLPIGNFTMSLFQPVSVVTNLIRSFGVAEGNDVAISASLRMTPYGMQVITDATLPIDRPLISGRYQDVSPDTQPYFWINDNSSSWVSHRSQRLAFVDFIDGWSSHGRWRGGELCTPRMKRLYGTTRTFTFDPTTMPFAISQSVGSYNSNIEQAHLRRYFDCSNNNDKFLNYTSGSNDWRKLIAPGPTYLLKDMAFVGPFNTGPQKLANLQAWKEKGTSSFNNDGVPDFLDYQHGSGREGTYYGANKDQFVNGGTTSDDSTIIPNVLPLTAEHFNIAVSAVNAAAGTRLPEGGYVNDAYLTLTQMFPANAFTKGFTEMKRQYSSGIANIKPITCRAMWVGGTDMPISGGEWWHDDSSSAALAAYGVTYSTFSDFPDQAKIGPTVAHGAVTHFKYVDVNDGQLHDSIYPYGDSSNGSQSLWVEDNGIWKSLYPVNIPIDRIRWLDLADMNTISNAKGLGDFSNDPKLLIPLVFDCIMAPTAAVVASDNSGPFPGIGYNFPCSALGWYNEASGANWVGEADEATTPISGGNGDMWAMRSDTSQIKNLLIQYGPGVSGNQCSLVSFDFGRLPEKWDTNIGSFMPFGLTGWPIDYPYCVTSHNSFNDIIKTPTWGNNSYIFRWDGPASGSLRATATIYPIEVANYDRNTIGSVAAYNQFLNWKDVDHLFQWKSISRSTVGTQADPIFIQCRDNDTVIKPGVGYGLLEINHGFHDFSKD